MVRHTFIPAAAVIVLVLALNMAPALAISNASVIGDPIFQGLLGQHFSVHGVDGWTYSLISDASVQLNSRFTHLSSGQCLTDSNGLALFTCFTTPGSYMSSLALHTTSGDHRVYIRAGAAREGFRYLTVDGRPLRRGSNVTLTGGLTVSYVGLRTARITSAGLYSLDVENSDGFVNLVAVTVSNWQALTRRVQSHGLIGQTWRDYREGREVSALEGVIDDYAERSNELWGSGFKFDKHTPRPVFGPVRGAGVDTVKLQKS